MSSERSSHRADSRGNSAPTPTAAAAGSSSSSSGGGSSSSSAKQPIWAMFGLSRSRLSATDILDGKLKKGVRSAEGFYTVASVGSSTLIDNIIGTAVGTSTKIFSQSTEQIGKWSSAAVAGTANAAHSIAVAPRRGSLFGGSASARKSVAGRARRASMPSWGTKSGGSGKDGKAKAARSRPR